MKAQRSAPKQQGSVLIEALISIALFAITTFGLLGLVGSALNAVTQSKARNDIGYLAGELIAEIWVSSSVDIAAWTTRLAAIQPGAVGKVYQADCTCALTGATYACPSPNTAIAATNTNVAIAKVQPVTICVLWTDKADQHLYQTSSMISR